MSLIFKMFIMPPSGPLLLGLLAVALLRWRRRAGVALLVTSVLLGYVFSIGFTANLLSRYVQCCEPLSMQSLSTLHPGAIVVLGGGIYEKAPEYGGDTIHLRTLGRIRYAARLARQSGLPLLATGGYGYGDASQSSPEGMLMARALEEEFGISGVLVENTSRNTWENATHSAALLNARGIDTIVLVTHAAHMRRAAQSFERAGLRVIPAPTIFFPRSLEVNSLDYWTPSVQSIYEINYDLHELFGLFWYRWGAGA